MEEFYKAESYPNSRPYIISEQNNSLENQNKPKKDSSRNSEIINGLFGQIYDLLTTNDFESLNIAIEQFVLFLNFEESEDYEEQILCFFIDSQFFKYLTIFLESNNEKFIITLLKCFISLSMLSSDFIEILIPFFEDLNFLIDFLQKNINSNEIISYILLLFGIISQYSEIFAQIIINSIFLNFCIDVLLNSHKFYVLNFIHKLVVDISDEIDFEKSFNSFELLFGHLKFILYSIIKKHSNEKEKSLSEVLEYNIKLSILILSIFQKCFLIPQIKPIVLRYDIFQFMLNTFYLFNPENVFFINILPISIEIIEFGYELLQNNNISHFFNIVSGFLNYLSYEEKSLLIKPLVSIICKSKDYIIDNIATIDVKIFYTLIDYIGAEIDYSNDIINLILSLFT